MGQKAQTLDRLQDWLDEQGYQNCHEAAADPETAMDAANQILNSDDLVLSDKARRLVNQLLGISSGRGLSNTILINLQSTGPVKEMACRISLPIVAALVSSSLVFGSDEFPTAVLLDDLREHQGPDAGMYDDAHHVWLSVEQLARERDEWRYGLNPVQDNVLVALEVLEELGREEDHGSLLGAMVQPGAAKQYGRAR